MPEELRTWAQDTVLASGVGLAVGPVQAPAGAASKAHAARAMAEAQTERLVRVMNASLKAGLRVGGLAAVFYAAEALSGIYRGRRDFYDTAVGGMTAGTLFGVAVARGGGQRGGPALLLRSAVLGAALGAAAGVPVGLLQDKLVSLMPEKARQQRRQRHEQTEAIIRGDVKHDMPVSRNYDVTAAVIEQLEASLARSPTQQAAVAKKRDALQAHAEHLEWMRKVPEAKVYRPTAEEWADPLAYIRSIQPEAAGYGICSIEAPAASAVPATLALELVRPGFRFGTRRQAVRGAPWDRWDAVHNPEGRAFTLREYQSEAETFMRRAMGGAPGEMRPEYAEAEFWREWERRDGAPLVVHYGLNVEGSAFVDEDPLGATAWNLRRLPLHEWSVLRHLEVLVEGVSTPMLYIGMLFAHFAWHVEDHHMHSINYQHQGAAKTWYGVPASAADAFERVARDTVYASAAAATRAAGSSEEQARRGWTRPPGGGSVAPRRGVTSPASLKICQQVADLVSKSLQGKTTMFSPRLLVEAGARLAPRPAPRPPRASTGAHVALAAVLRRVPVFRAAQRPGTFVVTFPRAMHAGFGNGFNLGEAVNFGLQEWWPYAASSRALYRRQRWGQCITHEQVLCADALQLAARLAAANAARGRGGAPAQEEGAPKQEAAEPDLEAAPAAGAAAAGHSAAPGDMMGAQMPAAALPPASPCARLAALQCAASALERQLAAARAEAAAAAAARGTMGADNAVAHTFVDMVRRLHHCRRLLERQPGTAVVAACADMRDAVGAASLLCGVCLDPCYVASAVLDVAGERLPAAPSCSAAAGRPDEWRHVCLECAARRAQRAEPSSADAGPAAPGGLSIGSGGAAAPGGQPAARAQPAAGAVVLFVKPLWGRLVACCRALEARGIRPLADFQGVPLPLAGVQAAPAGPPYGPDSPPPPERPYSWAALRDPERCWPQAWREAEAVMAEAAREAGRSGDRGEWVLCSSPQDAWLAALQAQAASAAAAAGGCPAPPPRPAGKRKRRTAGEAACVRVRNASAAPAPPAVTPPAATPSQRPPARAGPVGGAGPASPAASGPAAGQGAAPPGVDATPTLRAAPAAAPHDDLVNTPQTPLPLVSESMVVVCGQRLPRRVFGMNGEAWLVMREALAACGARPKRSQMACSLVRGAGPPPRFSKAYLAGAKNGTAALLMRQAEVALLARWLPEPQRARLAAFVAGVWPEADGPSAAAGAAGGPAGVAPVDVDMADAPDREEEEEEEGEGVAEGEGKGGPQTQTQQPQGHQQQKEQQQHEEEAHLPEEEVRLKQQRLREPCWCLQPPAPGRPPVQQEDAPAVPEPVPAEQPGAAPPQLVWQQPPLVFLPMGPQPPPALGGSMVLIPYAAPVPAHVAPAHVTPPALPPAGVQLPRASLAPGTAARRARRFEEVLPPS
eukprot:scaffold11.g3889.t1